MVERSWVRGRDVRERAERGTARRAPAPRRAALRVIRAWRRTALAAAAAAICASAGCERENEPRTILAPTGYGVMAGVVHGALDPQDYEASLSGEDEQGDSRAIAARCDSSGAFSLRAPYGTYRLRFSTCVWDCPGFYFTAGGPVAANGEPLVLSPGHERIRADVELATVRLRLALPPVYRGREVPVYLVGRDALGHYVNEFRRATCEGETTEVVISGTIPGRYRVGVELRSRQTVWLPAGADYESATEFDCGPGSTDLPVMAIPEPGRVAIHVSGSWRELRNLAGAPSLRVFSEDSLAIAVIPMDAAGEEAGEISGEILWPEPMRFLLDVGGVSRWIGGSSFEEAATYRIGAGESLALPAVTESGVVCRFDGAVFDRLHSDPQVLLHRALGEGPPLGSKGPTGNYVAFCNLDPGTYHLELARQSDDCEGWWRPEWFENGASREDATPIVIREAGEVVRLEWVVKPGGEIHGRIDPPSGDPEWSPRVELLAAADSNSVLCDTWVYVAEPGFRFAGLADGAYVLRTRFPSQGRWRNWWYPGTRDRLRADTLRVIDGSEEATGPWPGR